MKLQFKQAIIGIIAAPLALAAVFAILPSSTVNAADPKCDDKNLSVTSGAECAKGKNTKSSLATGEDSVLKTVTNVLLFIVGAISVIMIVVGGIRYVISNGEAAQITSAKNTIMYAVIGLVIALLAYAIVNFVVNSFVANPSGGSSATN